MPSKDTLTAVRSLRNFLYYDQAVFAVGGAISSAEPSSLSATKGSMPSQTSRSSPVVTIRWQNLEDDRTCRTVSLPLLSKEDPDFTGLVCDYHEGRMSNVTVDFSPYDIGILDAVSRLLYPGYGPVKDWEPRSEQGYGRLLVCLPYRHLGGSLTLLCQDGKDDTRTLELDWAEESGFGKIQWAAFLNPTHVSQSAVTQGHSVVLAYTLWRTSYGIGEAPVPLLILDNEDEGEITVGYSCAGDYSFPLIEMSPSAGEGLQGFLTGTDLLVYHIFVRLACNVRTRIVPYQDKEYADNEEKTQDAADSRPSPLPTPDLPKKIWWLNHSPDSYRGLWRNMLLSVKRDSGREGLEGRPCATVIIATLAPRRRQRDAEHVPVTPIPAALVPAGPPATRTAGATLPPRKRKRYPESGENNGNRERNVFSP
ncbi:hypothetical protein F5Y16DRAFT_406697 [Xylariaceae sp. FL0255]|nr:hypothetical protein F5Y16DRAFT_406697 [Xylariaceae sp. FL0255]